MRQITSVDSKVVGGGSKPALVAREPAPSAIRGERPIADEIRPEQRRSQISDGHRLLRLVRQRRHHLYTADEHTRAAVHISADYWLDSVVPALQVRMNEAIARRVNAAIVRARSQGSQYGVSKTGVAEYVAEAFFDNWWFKPNPSHMSRIAVRDKIQSVIRSGSKIQLIFPIFSRKPISPIKNRGTNPDLCELHSLVRCAEATQVINALSPTGCELIVLADGHKYNRACGTPKAIVDRYQSGLQFWINTLDLGDLVRVVNYENFLLAALDARIVTERQSRYNNYQDSIEASYGARFEAGDIAASLQHIAQDDIGEQLSHTFWSIVTSVNYKELHDLSGGETEAEHYYGDAAQKLYVAYASTLHRSIGSKGFGNTSSPSSGYVDPLRYSDLFLSMRQSAWHAAVRYVAISLADRDLILLKLIKPLGIKLTIHGKPGELHFLSATQQDAAMTAQHSTGGLCVGRDGATKITFRYRLERESNGERPVLIERLADTPFNREHYGPLWEMQRQQQPFAYVPDQIVGELNVIHRTLTRRA